MSLASESDSLLNTKLNTHISQWIQDEPTQLTSDVSIDFVDRMLSTIQTKQSEILGSIQDYLSENREILQLEDQFIVNLQTSSNHIKQKIHAIRSEVLDPELGLRPQCQIVLEQYSQSLAKEKTYLQIRRYLKRGEKIKSHLNEAEISKSKEKYKETAELLVLALQKAERGTQKYPFLLVYRNAVKVILEKLASFTRTCLELLHATLVVSAKEIRRVTSLDRCQDLFDAYFIARGDLHLLVEWLYPQLLQGTWVASEDRLTASDSVPEDVASNVLGFYQFLRTLLPLHSQSAIGSAFHEHTRHVFLHKVYLSELPVHLEGLDAFRAKVCRFDALETQATAWGLSKTSVPLVDALDFPALVLKKRTEHALHLARHLWLNTSNLQEVVYEPAAPATPVTPTTPALDSATYGLSHAFTLLDPKIVHQSPLRMHPQRISKKMSDFLELLQTYPPLPLLHLYTICVDPNLHPKTVPRLALLQVSDTMVLIHWCTQQHMADPTPELVQLIAQLSELVKRVYKQQLTYQKGVVFETFQPALKLMSRIEELGVEKIQLYVHRIQALVKQLRSAVEDILPPPLYYHFLGTLLDSILSALLAELLTWEDITVLESELLYDCWVPFLASLPVPSKAAWIPHFAVVSSMFELFKSSLKQIQTQLWHHHFQHCSAQHLIHFIHALFQESELRRNVVHDILQGVQRGVIQK